MDTATKKAAGTYIGLVLALSLTGCATRPDQPPLVQPRAINSYASAASMGAPPVLWPSEGWWAKYQDPQLNRLVDEALSGSPSMAAAAARLRAAQAAEDIVAAAQSPQVSLNASAAEQKQSYNYLTPSNVTPQGWRSYGQATLDFTWELDFWGRNRAALAAATSELEANRIELAQAKLVLSTAVVAEYAELARMFASWDSAAEAARVWADIARLMTDRFANALETRAAAAQAEARRATAEGNLLELDEQIGRQRHRLAALLGDGPDRGLSIEQPKYKLDQAFGLPRELALNLLGRRPDIAAARLRVQARSSTIEQRQAAFYPNINLVGLFGAQSLGLGMLTKAGSGIGSIGPALSLPIFDGRLKGQLLSARADYEEAVAVYDQTITQALRELADAALSLQALDPQLRKAEEAVAATTMALGVANARYTAGLANYIEVLSAEDSHLSSVRALAELHSRSLSLDVALMRALGGGYQTTQN